MIDKLPQAQIMGQVISVVEQYMNINKYQMGENIYLSSLIELINNVGGVLNVVDLRIYKNWSGVYSLNEISQPYINLTTRQVNISDYNFCDPISMFEIRRPSVDIIRVK
jgi:hypothetical protein